MSTSFLTKILGAVALVAAVAITPVLAQDAAAPAAAPADATAAPADAAAAPAEAAAAPEALAPLPSGPKAEQEVVENPYGLQALWDGGDFVSRGTLVILVLMSTFSWYILIVRLWDQTTLMKHSKSAGAGFWRSSSLQEGVKTLEANSPFRYIVENGLRATEHHEGKLTDQIDLHEWVSMSLSRSTEQINSKLQGGLAFLATVGSTAPFIGLFGTVVGIYKALTAIGISGQASIDKVAGPVGEALIMTAFGLFVAVPAVLAYNWLVRRNKIALEQIRNFAADIHAFLLSGSRIAQAGGRAARG